ncbi:MAG: hypothetical protein Q9196_004460, partial [Gyalolechia fulgens]
MDAAPSSKSASTGAFDIAKTILPRQGQGQEQKQNTPLRSPSPVPSPTPHVSPGTPTPSDVKQLAWASKESTVIVSPSPMSAGPPTNSESQQPGLTPTGSTPSSVSSATTSPSSASTSATSLASSFTTSGPTGEATTNPSSANQTSGEAIPRHNSGSDAISPGAAAGIGIACAIAGALIAAAILALLFKRRRHRRPARGDAVQLDGFASLDKTTVSSRDLPSPLGLIERSLPQPVEDQALGGELSRLRTSIKNHVQSYYHTNSVVGSVDQAALGIIAAGNMPLIASTLASLLSNPATRLTALRFCIAWVAISRIDPSCEPSRSFLPPEIAGCLVSIASAPEDPSTHMDSLGRWRAITASLLQSKYGGGNFGSYDARNHNLSEALQALDTVLSPFMAQKRDERGRKQHLEEILRRGARFGFLLFSRPSTWELDWNVPPDAGRGVLAISPSLVQVGDDNGRRLSMPRTVEEQELAKGLEP